MSFFDEDDEPRTRVRPRRPATSRSGRPDRQTVLLRQGLLFGGFIVVLVLLIVIVNGCRQSAKENAFKDYNRDVGRARARLRQRGRQAVLRPPPEPRLERPAQPGRELQVAGRHAVPAGQADQHARRPDRGAAGLPDHDGDAPRRPAVDRRQDPTALGSDPDTSDQAINEIAGAMEYFLASDVDLHEPDAAVHPGRARQAGDRRPAHPAHRVLPGLAVAGSQHGRGRARAAAVGRRRGGAGGREPAPGLHGTGIDSVAVGDVTLQPGTANRITYGPDTEFSVNFTNQGENDEVDIDVILRIEGGPEPIRVTDNVASLAAGRDRHGVVRARDAAAVRHAGDHQRRGQAGAGRGEARQQQRRVRRAVLAAVAVA